MGRYGMEYKAKAEELRGVWDGMEFLEKGVWCLERESNSHSRKGTGF